MFGDTITLFLPFPAANQSVDSPKCSVQIGCLRGSVLADVLLHLCEDPFPLPCNTAVPLSVGVGQLLHHAQNRALLRTVLATPATGIKLARSFPGG